MLLVETDGRKPSFVTVLLHVVGLSSINIHTEITVVIEAVSPVWILRTDMHLQQDPLGEGFEALATLPEMPVTELTAQLAGGGWACQDPLVL